VQTTRFKVWLQPGARPVWTGLQLVHPPESAAPDAADALDIAVKGDGSDLKRLIVDRPDIFAAYLQLKSAER
jgi:hypothetical protein